MKKFKLCLVLVLQLGISFARAEDLSVGKGEGDAKFGPGFMLPTEFLGGSNLKPQIVLPPEYQSENNDKLEELLSTEEQPPSKGTPDDPGRTGIHDSLNPFPRSPSSPEEEREEPGKFKPPADITLALNPEGSDLEFRHENATRVQDAPVPNFTAQIFTLDYDGVKKPVLIVQPALKKRPKGPDHNGNASKKNREGQEQLPRVEGSIPNFNIHFPLQTNSQFQIPRFNFTLPTLFLPGLVFTQNENIDKNTHELHVSIPQSDPSEYEQFPSTLSKGKIQVLPMHQAPSKEEILSNSNHPEVSQDVPEKSPQLSPELPVYFREPPKEILIPIQEKSGTPSLSHATLETDQMTPILTEEIKSPESSAPKAVIVNMTLNDLKNPGHIGKPIDVAFERIKEKVNDLVTNGPSGLRPPQSAPPSLKPPQAGVQSGLRPPHVVPFSAIKPPQAPPAHTDAGAPSKGTTLLNHFANSHPMWPSFPMPTNPLRPNNSTGGGRWKLPSFGQIYSRWFGGEARTGEDGDEFIPDCGGSQRMDDYDELAEDDPSLCGDDTGLCGATCNRMGFYAGKCVDTTACVCLLKQRPEFGLQLEYYVDRRARLSQSEGLYPVFGLCHNSACRINCEMAGYVTGACDSTCYCGRPWAEKVPNP